MDIQDCLETIRDLLWIQRDEERAQASRVFRKLVEDGAPADIAAQAMIDSGRFERRDVLDAIEDVLGRDSEEARQLLTAGRFTGLRAKKNA